MKVGLLSTQFTINYGAVLQAYSLFNYIDQIDGVDIQVINYAPQSARYGHFEGYDFSSFKSCILSLSKILNRRYIKSRKKKIQKFQDFVNAEFILSGQAVVNYEDLSLTHFDYDVGIVGSDQVWNPRVINDQAFYLSFLSSKGVKKISYAASLGDVLNEGMLSRLVENIKDFCFVSLREPMQREEISSAIGKEVDVLCDPVFLTARNDWLKLSEKSTEKVNEPYILLYEVNSPPDFKRYVSELKKLYPKHKFIAIRTNSIPKYFGVTEYASSGPYDFLALFQNAEFILTSSFHGLVFSTIFNKNFACVLGVDRSSRQRNILTLLKLSDREITSIAGLRNSLQSKIDWTSVNAEIECIKNEGAKFLSKVLANDC